MASRNQLGFKHRNSYSVNAPAPVGYDMGKGVYGSYDGLVLEPPDSKWKAYPAQNPLLKNPIFVPQGSGIPLRNEEVPVNIPDDSMFIFAKNVASKYCRGTYSTSTGAVCTTKQQRDLINQRGQNNKYGYLQNPQF